MLAKTPAGKCMKRAVCNVSVVMERKGPSLRFRGAYIGGSPAYGLFMCDQFKISDHK